MTYKFAASINDKKARDKFMKGPLKLQLILETIELDNYNRKYGEKRTKFKRRRKNSSESTSEDEQVGYTKPVTKKKVTFTSKKKLPNEIVIFVGRPTGHPVTLARHGSLNAIIAKSRDILQTLADPRP